ncbi:MAG TPA: membrane protein insertase YidC [Prolixibacteraceae bacterium]|nr:membrane protein insertase YidC [Prolixibacteraceae bacterium]
MDKNTIAGLVLIFAILFTASYFNRTSDEDLEKMRLKNDSIALAERVIATEKAKQIELSSIQPGILKSDSANVQNELSGLYGVFAVAAKGEEKFITMENNLMRVVLSNKGGKIYSVELKNYKRYNGKPLVLFEGETNRFGLNFFSHNKSIQTDHFFFQPSVSENLVAVNSAKIPVGKEGREKYNKENPGDSKSVSMRLDAGDNVFIEYVYTLKDNSYLVGFDIKTSGLKKVAGTNTEYVNFLWSTNLPRQEKMSKFGEDSQTTIYYKFDKDEVDKLDPAKSESKSLSTKVKWVGFKQQFFSSVLIADQAFQNAQISTKKSDLDSSYVAEMTADLTIPLDVKGNENFPAKIYFGPNQYNTLNQFDLGIEEQLPLGWTIFGWVNKYIVIPAFDFLHRYIGNFGLIILLLTIYIKLLTLIFTYKSYISQAKMKLLKPEIEEIQKKYGEDKKLESQQAVMAFYKKAGVNPLGGCLPMLLQMPILIAMFYFFPISIELRQQSFLWATDLSTYDSIATLPFTIPFYGNHVSLFCLLMTVTNIFYVKYNNEMTGSTQQMPGMKTMMYLMPVMFLFIFNSYAAGLSLYYFLSLVLTFVQMYIFKKLINEDKIHAQLKAKQKMPVTKSKFQAKLEDMAKQKALNDKRKK